VIRIIVWSASYRSLFFFPSRRRHTRSKRDWSSDVCSSDLSDAVRRVKGVKEAAQYTVPDEMMINKILAGEAVDYNQKDAHNREVYVVLEEDANPTEVEDEIKEMPNYFAGYQTGVSFISEEEFKAEHQKMPHGGRVIRQGKTSDDAVSIIDFSLSLESNPEFTAAVNIAYARAAYKLSQTKEYGAK